MPENYRRKLIEVALPLEAINDGAKPETENPFLKGHPRSIHNWWARTPLSVARAIIFAQLIDDPGNDLPPEEARIERDKLMTFVAKLATWKATENKDIINKARKIIEQQFKGDLPEFWDMFAGRGSIPLEAQRLGLPVTSSDLNPVSIVIQKALMFYPPNLINRKPIHDTQSELFSVTTLHPLDAVSKDIRWYGMQILKQAKSKLSHYYPIGPNNKDVIAWIWARSVDCPNPACRASVPLFKLSKLADKKGKVIQITCSVDKTLKEISFNVESGKILDNLSTVGRGGGTCPICKEPIPLAYIRVYAQEKGFGYRLLTVVVDGGKRREYYAPSKDQENVALSIQPDDPMEIDLPSEALGFGVQKYGMTKHSQLYTPRQLVALGTLSDLVRETHKQILHDSSGDRLYADAITTYLACAVSRMADYHCALTTWNPSNENIGHLFQMQTVPMVWDFAEANPINGPLDFGVALEWVIGSLSTLPADNKPSRVIRMDARQSNIQFNKPVVISTDPPYYDNIGYADLSDFFYVWLRRSLRDMDPDLFATVLTPKNEELIAYAPRHNGSDEKAKEFFEGGFKSTFNRIKSVANHNVPITVYYAFKQSDLSVNNEVASTGWETFLSGLINAGYIITATLPVRTTKAARARALGANALASAVILAIRPLDEGASSGSRKDFLHKLKTALPIAVKDLIAANVPPVDLAQAAIGPGMAIFSRYKNVLESDGSSMGVRTALALINQALDEFLAEQEGEYDSDTRWALIWFEQYGHNEAAYGVAETLSRAKNTSVDGLSEAGIVEARGGKVRLYKRDELDTDWDPATDKRLTAWESAAHLIYALENGGEESAAELLAKLGSVAEVARDLAYRLYTVCERKGWSQDALGYNMLVVAWPRLKELSARRVEPGQGKLM
jgi:putative DNA methylase